MSTDARISLAIELSSRTGAVAAGRDDDFLGVEAVRQEARHSDDLMAAINRLFSRIGSSPAELADIHVSIGPGGFTGLRIATTTAKMLALALGAKVIAVPTAVAVAESEPIAAGRIAVALGYKRGIVWLTTLESDGRQPWRVVGEPRLMSVDDVLDLAPRPAAIVIDHGPDLVDACRTAGLPVRPATFDATAVWRVGRRLAKAGAYVDPRLLTPLYAREPEAVRLWESRQPRQAE